MASTAPASDVQAFLEQQAGQIVVADAGDTAVSYQIHTGTTYTLNFWRLSLGGYENANVAGGEARMMANMKQFVVLGNAVRLLPSPGTLGQGVNIEPHPEVPQGMFLVWRGEAGRPAYVTEDDGTITCTMAFAVLPPFVNIINGGC